MFLIPMFRNTVASCALVISAISPANAQGASISQDSDGYAWRKAPLEDRMGWCITCVEYGKTQGLRVNSRTLFDAIQEFYTTGDAKLLNQKLYVITALCMKAADGK